MTNNWITWVLLAPGFASGFCFITEDFIEGLQALWEHLERCCGRNRERKAVTDSGTGLPPQQSE